MSAIISKYSEVMVDKAKVPISELISEIFITNKDYKISLNIDYDTTKLKYFSDVQSILQKEFPVLQKNLSYFPHLQKKIEHFNEKVLYVRNFNYSKIFGNFMRTLSQKINLFYEDFYSKTFQPSTAIDQEHKKEFLKELDFNQLRSRLKNEVIKISNELYSVLSDKPQIVFEEELSTACEKIIRLNEFLNSNESAVISFMKPNYGSFLLSVCSQHFEEIDYYLCIDQEKMHHLLNDARMNLPKHYPIHMSRKKFMLEGLHKIITDDLSLVEQRNKIDIKAVGRAVFQRDRKNIEKELGDAVRIVVENKDLKDDAEDFKRNVDNLTNEMQRIRLEGEIIKENPAFVKILDGSIDLEMIGFLEENERNEELLMKIEKLACDYYKFMKNVKELFERMMYFTKEEELFYKNKYYQVLNNIIHKYTIEVDRNKIESLIDSLFIKLNAWLLKEKNAIVNNELEGKLLTELDKNQDNPYLGQLFMALQDAERNRDAYSRHIKDKQNHFIPKAEDDRELQQTKLTKEMSDYVYKETKKKKKNNLFLSAPPGLSKAKSLQIQEKNLKEQVDFNTISPTHIKKPTIFSKAAKNERESKQPLEPNYDFEKNLKSDRNPKLDMVHLSDNDKEAMLSGKSKEKTISIEDDFMGKTSSRSKGLNVKFDDNPPSSKRFDDERKDSKKNSSRNLLFDVKEKEEDDMFPNNRDYDDFGKKKHHDNKNFLGQKGQDDDYYNKKSPKKNEDEDDFYKHKEKKSPSSKNLLGDIHRKNEDDYYKHEGKHSNSSKNLLGDMHRKDDYEDNYLHPKEKKSPSSKNLLGDMHKNKDEDDDDYLRHKEKKSPSSKNLMGDIHKKKDEDEDDYFRHKEKKSPSSKNLLLGDMHKKKDEDDSFRYKEKKSPSNKNLLGDMHKKKDEDEDDYFRPKDKQPSSKNLLGNIHKKKDEDEDDYFRPKDKQPSSKNLLGDMHKKKDEDEDDYFRSKDKSRDLLGDRNKRDDDDDSYMKHKNQHEIKDFNQPLKKSPFSKASDHKLPGFDDEEEEIGFGNNKNAFNANRNNPLNKQESFEIQETFPEKQNNPGWGAIDKKIDNFGDFENEDNGFGQKKKHSPKDSKKNLFGDNKTSDSHRFLGKNENIDMERPLMNLAPAVSEEMIGEKSYPMKKPEGKKKSLLAAIEKEAEDGYEDMFMKAPNSRDNQPFGLEKPSFGLTQQESDYDIQQNQPEKQSGFSHLKPSGLNFPKEESHGFSHMKPSSFQPPEDDSPEIIPEYKVDDRKPLLRPLEKQKAGLLKPLKEEPKPFLRQPGNFDDSLEVKDEANIKMGTFDDDLNVLDDLLPSGGKNKPAPLNLPKGKGESPGKSNSPLKKGMSPMKKKVDLKDLEGDEAFEEELIEEYQDDFHEDENLGLGASQEKSEEKAENQLNFEPKPLFRKEDLEFIDMYMTQSGLIGENLPIELLNNIDVLDTLMNEALAQEKAFFFSLQEGEKLALFFDKFNDNVVKSGKLQALKHCEKELNAVSEHLMKFHLAVKEKMEIDLNCRIFIPFDKPTVAFYLVELFIPAQKVFFYYKKNPDKKAQDRAKNMMILLQEIFKFPDDTEAMDVVLKGSSASELDKLKKLNHLPYIATTFQILYETAEAEHAKQPLIDFDKHLIERMFVIASLTGEVFQLFQGESLELLTQHFDELQKLLSAGPDCLIIHHEETLNEEMDTNKIAEACYEILGSCLKKLSEIDQIFLSLVVVVGAARFAYYFHFTAIESESKPIMRLFYLVEYDSMITGIVLQIANSFVNPELAFECFFDFSRHNGLYEFSKISAVIWAEYCVKQEMNAVEGFRLMSYSMIPFYAATRGLVGEGGEEEGDENMAMMGQMEGEEELYDEGFEVDENMLPE